MPVSRRQMHRGLRETRKFTKLIAAEDSRMNTIMRTAAATKQPTFLPGIFNDHLSDTQKEEFVQLQVVERYGRGIIQPKHRQPKFTVTTKKVGEVHPLEYVDVAKQMKQADIELRKRLKRLKLIGYAMALCPDYRHDVSEHLPTAGSAFASASVGPSIHVEGHVTVSKQVEPKLFSPTSYKLDKAAFKMAPKEIQQRCVDLGFVKWVHVGGNVSVKHKAEAIKPLAKRAKKDDDDDDEEEQGADPNATELVAIVPAAQDIDAALNVDELSGDEDEDERNRGDLTIWQQFGDKADMFASKKKTKKK